MVLTTILPGMTQVSIPAGGPKGSSESHAAAPAVWVAPGHPGPAGRGPEGPWQETGSEPAACCTQVNLAPVFIPATLAFSAGISAAIREETAWGGARGATLAGLDLGAEGHLPLCISLLPSRVREQLQNVQAQWARVQERSEQRRLQLLASLQLQVRVPPWGRVRELVGVPGALPGLRRTQTPPLVHPPSAPAPLSHSWQGRVSL